MLTNGKVRLARRLHSITFTALAFASSWMLKGPEMFSAAAMCAAMVAAAASAWKVLNAKAVKAVKAEKAEKAEADSAFVEMNAVFEAVMKAIRGEYLSDFELSHGAVYEAQMLRDVNAIHVRDNEALKAERDELALLTVPSDDDAQVAVRLRIAEERVEELENEIVSWRGAQAVRFLGDAGDRDAYPIRREAEIKLNEVAASILAARSAKGEANG